MNDCFTISKSTVLGKVEVNDVDYLYLPKTLCYFCKNIRSDMVISLQKAYQDDVFVQAIGKLDPGFSLDNIKDFPICNTCHLTIYNFTDEPYLNFDDHRLEACESGSFEVNSIIPLTVKLTVSKTIDRLCQIYDAEFKYNNNNGDDISIERRTTGLGNTLAEGNSCDRNQLENYKLFKNQYVPGIYKATQLLNRELTDKSVNEFVLYKCQQCNFQTIYKRNLKRHRIIHDLFVVYKGLECTYKTNDKTQLKRHVTIHKNSNEIQMCKCNVCNFQTIYKTYLIPHLTDRKSENKVHMYKCRQCTFQSKYKCSLKKHTLIHQGNEDFKIVRYECEYKLRYERSLSSFIHNGEVKTYSCPKCQYETLNKYNMRAHLLMHKTKNHNLTHKIVKEVVMYKCQQCTFQAKCKSDIKRHAIVHKRENEVHMYKCHQCTFQSKYKWRLKKHILIHQNIRNCTLHLTLHNDEENKNREFTQESTNAITKQHSYEIQMYKCNECYFQTKYRRHLILHLYGRKNRNKGHIYKCEQCTFQTKYKCSLKRHTLIHQGNDDIDIKMYECNECYFQTKFRKHLIRHLYGRKNGNKGHIYECEQCTFQTKYKCSLKRHTLIHEGNDDIDIKMYECNECYFQTKSRKHLIRHLYGRKNGNKVHIYKCEQCTFQTKYKCSLKRHTLINKINDRI